MPPTVLSAQELERVASISEGGFVFIGNSCKIHCTQFQAAFISPRVSSLLEQDKTADLLFVECQHQQVSEKRIFEFIGQLLQGLPIDPLDSEIEAVFKIASFLGNRELMAKLMHDGSVDKPNVCSQLGKKSVLGISVIEKIEFAAAHFHELDLDQLKGIDVCILEAILSSESLCLQTEDSLLTFICSLDSKSRIVLLRYLRCEYLSCEGMAIFMDLVYDFGIDPLIWTVLCHRLRLPVWGRTFDVSPTGEPRCDGRRTVEIRLAHPESPSKSESLGGIIAYLTKKCGENVHTKGIVTVTSKTLADSPWVRRKYVLDLTSDCNFASRRDPGQ
jgi:hypothetical protein